ncbi:PhoH-like protein [compost metagenome]
MGTKVVLTGDVYQIDNPYVDSASSGLAYAVERFKGHPIAAHVTLTKGERSALAELAANIL